MSSYVIDVSLDTETVVIRGGALEAFLPVEGVTVGDVEATFGLYDQSVVRVLFDFLKGKVVEITPLARKLLRLVLEGKHRVPNFRPSLRLTDLKDEPYHNRGRLRTKWDLLHHLPLRYVDKSNLQNIEDLEPNVRGTIIGEVYNIQSVQTRSGKNSIIVTVEDGNKHRIDAWFFNQPWLFARFPVHTPVALTGVFQVKKNKYNGRLERSVTSATLETFGTYSSKHKIQPVYSEKVKIKKFVALREVEALLSTVGYIEDPVPEPILEKYNLMPRDLAYREIHFPSSLESAVEARKRIAFDDFIRLQVHLKNIRAKEKHVSAPPLVKTILKDVYVKSLPFSLTGAQERVLKEIGADLGSASPMRRLLHGEVGSGKTEVATAVALQAVSNGYQTAILAPTSVLAHQLYERVLRDINNASIANVKPVILVSGLRVKERRETLATIESGEANIIIGTHSILSGEVAFNKLGLVIIDEQHKFGTEQRDRLFETNKETEAPHVLMMSATPIPRTMSQTIYGHMDLSVIDELPAEREPVETHWNVSEEEGWDKMREQLGEGRQVYVITALVEETENAIDVDNALQTQAFLQTNIFPEYKVGLVHGKMKTIDKNEALAEFVQNKVQVLVATSAVEVGVNVPNATVIMILNANRFGIASLHQIRGRVGRGQYKGYCYLIASDENLSPDAEERLSSLVVSNDGFWLAEVDLNIRGEGALMKQSQSGDNDLFLANLREHKPILQIAQRVAEQAVKSKQMQLEVDIMFQNKQISL